MGSIKGLWGRLRAGLELRRCRNCPVALRLWDFSDKSTELSRAGVERGISV